MADTTKGLTKDQLVAHFKRELSTQGENQADLWKQLYEPEDLTLVTENHASIIPTKLRFKMVSHAIDPNRTKSLVDLWISDYNSEMISFKRQGRFEGLGAMQALQNEDQEHIAKA